MELSKNLDSPQFRSKMQLVSKDPTKIYYKISPDMELKTILKGKGRKDLCSKVRKPKERQNNPRKLITMESIDTKGWGCMQCPATTAYKNLYEFSYVTLNQTKQISSNVDLMKPKQYIQRNCGQVENFDSKNESYQLTGIQNFNSYVNKEFRLEIECSS